tara:strand:- start:1384 stop:1635 length:252 start_codon:yes stop_codon:yes gene_type:complete
MITGKTLSKVYDMNLELRKLAILVLDDEHGIAESAYNQLVDMLVNNECQDILDAVDGSDGRYYIGEDVAEQMLKENIDAITPF